MDTIKVERVQNVIDLVVHLRSSGSSAWVSTLSMLVIINFCPKEFCREFLNDIVDIKVQSKEVDCSQGDGIQEHVRRNLYIKIQMDEAMCLVLFEHLYVPLHCDVYVLQDL